MERVNWLEKTLSTGGEGATEDELAQWHHWLNGHECEQTPGDSKDRKAWHTVVRGVTKGHTQLGEWTKKKKKKIFKFPTNKSPGLNDFIGELYQTFKEELTHPSQSVPKNWRETNPFEFILWWQHHFDIKTDIIKRENYGPI